MFQNSQKARFILEAGCAHKIREMALKITVNVTGGACRLAPIPLWFDRIELRTPGGSDLFDTSYGDVMLRKFLVIEKLNYRKFSEVSMYQLIGNLCLNMPLVLLLHFTCLL